MCVCVHSHECGQSIHYPNNSIQVFYQNIFISCAHTCPGQCVCVYTHVSMCVHTHTHTYTRAHTHHTHTYTYNVSIHMYTCIYMCICIWWHTTHIHRATHVIAARESKLLHQPRQTRPRKRPAAQSNSKSVRSRPAKVMGSCHSQTQKKLRLAASLSARAPSLWWDTGNFDSTWCLTARKESSCTHMRLFFEFSSCFCMCVCVYLCVCTD